MTMNKDENELISHILSTKNAIFKQSTRSFIDQDHMIEVPLSWVKTWGWDRTVYILMNEDAEASSEETQIGIEDVLAEMNNIYKTKNADYGDAFGKSLEKFGLIAAVVRMGDKMNRLDTLVGSEKNREVRDETLYDTFQDLANYSAMTCLWLKQHGRDM